MVVHWCPYSRAKAWQSNCYYTGERLQQKNQKERDGQRFTISLPCSDVSQSFSYLSLGSTGSKRRGTAERPLTLQRGVTTGLRPGTDFSPLATVRHWLLNCQRPNGARSRRAVPLFQYAPNQAPFADNSSRFSFLRISRAPCMTREVPS